VANPFSRFFRSKPAIDNQQATQATGNRAGQRLIERQLDVAPTLTVRPGWPLRVIVHKDIVLKPYTNPANP